MICALWQMTAPVRVLEAGLLVDGRYTAEKPVGVVDLRMHWVISRAKRSKRPTAPGLRAWSPTALLSGPERA